MVVYGARLEGTGMNGFGRVVVVINWLIVVALSLGAILWVGAPTFIGVGEFESIESMPAFRIDFVHFLNDIAGLITLVLCGCLMVILNILFVVRLIRRTGYQRSIRFKNPGGEVIVHLSAVEECLTRYARQSEDVHDVKVRVYSGTKGNPVRVVVTVSLWDTPDVPSIVEKLQGGLRGRFIEILNADESVDVIVTLRRLVTKKDSSRKAKGAEPAAEPVESGFKGPEYPID